VHQVIGQIAEACLNPPLAASDVIDRLEAQGATQTATELRRVTEQPPPCS
jgi:hypothetical protein